MWLNYHSVTGEKTIQEFLRFVLVGVLATGIHYGAYLLLIQLVRFDNALWTNGAYSIGYLVSWCCNLWLTARFTFRAPVTLRRGLGFAISHIVNFGLHVLFLNLFLFIGIPKKWAPIPVYCIVVPICFVLVRNVFKKQNDEES